MADRQRIVISAWSAVSPFGTGRVAYAAGVRGPAPPVADVACLVPNFDVRAVLGRKGTRAMDRATGFVVAAVGELVAANTIRPGAQTGMVLGTTNGNVREMAGFTRTSLTANRPFHVDPAVFPSVVMNYSATQCATWHGLKGPNVTVAGGRLAGLNALRFGSRLLRAGRARQVVCGGTEAWSAERARLDTSTTATQAGEGAAVVLMESFSDARHPLAEVLAIESRAPQGTDISGALTDCVSAALRRGGVDGGDLWRAEPGAPGTRAPVPVSGMIGDTGAASGLLQVCAALAVATEDSIGRCFLVVSTGRRGDVACGLFRTLAQQP